MIKGPRSDRCLACNRVVDASSHLRDEEARPKPEDLSICLYCGHLMAYDKELKLRELTDAEIVEVAGRPDILELQRFRKAYHDLTPMQRGAEHLPPKQKK